jgi:hypothetical protein
MPNNMILLETIALTQSAASVTFDNLPTSGYTDLKIVVSARTDYAGNTANLYLKPNGATTNLSQRELYGTGSAAASTTDTHLGLPVVGATATASTFGNYEAYIPNYRSSNNKSISFDAVTENNATAVLTMLSAGLWSSSSTITSIVFSADGNLIAGSTFSLYGIAAFGTTPVLAPKATGGNRVENDGTYWIHTFLTSGVFTPQVGLTCDYLVIAGGGGGGAYTGGGGGAGGFRSTVTATGGGGALESALSVTNGTNYAITVGAGGAGQTGYTLPSSGSTSTFSTITSDGGGRGGGWALGFFAPTSGGSGGGGTYQTFTAGAAGTTNQGYAGGNGAGGAAASAGGGGGAGAVGGNASTVGGVGGAGVATSITGTSVTRAGGGGGGSYNNGAGTGGAGGAGGGGAGGFNAAGGNGTINTGSGGGGAQDVGTPPVQPGGNGGAGIVIIRYPIN